MVEPNMSRIDQVNPKDTENFMCSSNYMSLAVELGLYDPAGGKPFSWRLAYGDLWRASSVSGRWPRLWRAFNLLAPSAAPLRGWQMEDAPNYPFSVKPDKKLSVQDIWAVLNDTNVGTPFDNANDPAWFVRNPAGEWVKSNLATPDPTKELGDLIGLNWYRKGSATGNSYTFISQTRAWLPDAIGGVFWFEHDNAHNGLLVPVFVQNTSTPPSWAVADRTKFDRNSAWWAFGLVDDLVNQRYQVLKPLLEAVRGPLQKEIFDAQAAVEATALAKYNADPASARQYLTEYTNSLMLRVEAAYWALSDQFLYLLNNNKLGSPVRR
jgi:dipeptidase